MTLGTYEYRVLCTGVLATPDVYNLLICFIVNFIIETEAVRYKYNCIFIIPGTFVDRCRTSRYRGRYASVVLVVGS